MIQSKEFQRLRRIMQLDVAYLVYPNAAHNRFAHSLGVMSIATRMVNETHHWISMSGDKINTSEMRKMVGELRIASILHDIGHYALSHCGEEALKEAGGSGVPDHAHEKLGTIVSASSGLAKLIEDAAKDCGSTYENIMNYVRKVQRKIPRYIYQILDSGLDADKMDYLIRDSYHTGVACGIFERERILRMLRYHDDTLVVDSKGTNALESYLLARYEMHNQLYLHKTVSSFRGISQKIMSKFIKYGLFPSFKEINESPSLLEDVDDTRFFAMVHQSAKGNLFDSKGKQISDEGLQYLSNCLIWRKRIPISFARQFFKPPASPWNTPELVKLGKEEERFNKFWNKLSSSELDDAFNIVCKKYGVPRDSVIIRRDEIEVARVLKEIPKRNVEQGDPIFLLVEEGRESEMSDSLIDLISGTERNSIRVFSPDRTRDEIRDLLDSLWNSLKTTD